MTFLTKLGRMVLIFTACCVGAFVLLLVFLYYVPVRDVPFDALIAYAPGVAGTVPATGCVPSVRVARVDDLRSGFAALQAAEGDPDDGRYAAHIAHVLTCAQGKKTLRYELEELRIAAHIRRQFSYEQQMAMYLNLARMGDDRSGMTQAAQHYFGVSPDQLDTAQWALLCGMIQHPAASSPSTHPDRALDRRNEVLTAMHDNGTLTARAFTHAKAEPLGILTAAPASTASPDESMPAPDAPTDIAPVTPPDTTPQP